VRLSSISRLTAQGIDIDIGGKNISFVCCITHEVARMNESDCRGQDLKRSLLAWFLWAIQSSDSFAYEETIEEAEVV